MNGSGWNSTGYKPVKHYRVSPALYTQITLQNLSRRVRPRRGAQGNGYSIGKRRNAGMARLEGFPSGEPPVGHLLRCALLQWNNHCFKSAPCI